MNGRNSDYPASSQRKVQSKAHDWSGTPVSQLSGVRHTLCWSFSGSTVLDMFLGICSWHSESQPRSFATLSTAWHPNYHSTELRVPEREYLNSEGTGLRPALPLVGRIFLVILNKGKCHGMCPFIL